MMLLIPLVIFIALFFHKLCRKEATDSGTVLKLSDLLERYIFPQSQVMLSTKIGKGVFGTIYKGYAHKILLHENETLVAIKEVKEEVKGSSLNADSHIESQKVVFETPKRGHFYCDFSVFIFLDVIFGNRIKGFDAMWRTFKFGQLARNRCRKYCQP